MAVHDDPKVETRVEDTPQAKEDFSMLDDLFGKSGVGLSELDDGFDSDKVDNKREIHLDDDLFSAIEKATTPGLGLSDSKALFGSDDSDDPFGIFSKLKDETI